jgi:hypothetical protein
MQGWILKVQLDGEWEACMFGRREEAEATLDGLISDYGERVSEACLRSPQGSLFPVQSNRNTPPKTPLRG